MIGFSTLSNDFVIVFQNTSFHSLHDPEQECKIRIYGIATKDTTNLKLLSAALNDALFQFVNRYSRIDIQNKNLDKFAEFKSRFEKIFRDFIVKEKKEDILKTAKKMRMQEQARERNIEQHRYSMGNTRFT